MSAQATPKAMNVSKVSSKSRTRTFDCEVVSRCGCGRGSRVTKHEVTCGDIHCRNTAFGVQIRNRFSKSAAIFSHLRKISIKGSPQYLVLCTQLRYTDLPQPRIFKACTSFPVTNPWSCDGNEIFFEVVLAMRALAVCPPAFRFRLLAGSPSQKGSDVGAGVRTSPFQLKRA